jgi:predicted TIM-barrel fold metal-dependent hydrolase
VEAIARRHPGAPLIIAHTAHPATAEAIKLIGRYPNIDADLTPRVIDAVDVADEDLEANHERFLFGTDAPNTGVIAENSIKRLNRLPLPAREAILHGNAGRLLTNIT